MARLFFHFVFALIIASYLSSVSDAIVRDLHEPCFCPSTDPNCNCGDDLHVLTTRVIAPSPHIKQCVRCHKNSFCNKICPPKCKYKVCIYNRACDFATCSCYLC
ncbi:hypothetical protein CARUB_v10011982mg [Capsella rubella]|uniref:Bowman-Birk serine protease inhibitors family domain-containing protein n=1 Tax=Capsella rubella TaxID=81985 RepID=R0IGW8_9BRAS|nr:defensin-like protein 268 [Capsella rubella]EOA37610.1 hypothetical protein CARUB_v10011982mg [Capsella rubella]